MSKTTKASGRRSSKGSQRSSQGLWLWFGLIGVAVVAILAYAFVQYGGSANASPAEIAAAAAYTRYQTGADYFLDVRTSEEWAQAHLQNSALIPLADLPARLNELPRDREIVVVCATGSRSRQAQEYLQKSGFTRVINMKGGLTAWEAAGYPLVTGP